MNDLEYNMLSNLEAEGIYGKEAIPYLKEGFNLTTQQASAILLDYYKLPRLNKAGQATMHKYSNVNLIDIIIACIAAIGVLWAVIAIL